MSPPEAEWRTTLPATLDAIEEYCKEFRVWHAAHCKGLNRFAAELIIREALTNSIVHALSNAPDKKVCCVLRAKLNRILIVIQDEGKGFDWRAARNRTSGPSDTSGRGLEIYRHYASHVRFNAKGNLVALVKSF